MFRNARTGEIKQMLTQVMIDEEKIDGEWYKIKDRNNGPGSFEYFAVNVVAWAVLILFVLSAGALILQVIRCLFFGDSWLPLLLIVLSAGATILLLIGILIWRTFEK